jgi:hypothetical protein
MVDSAGVRKGAFYYDFAGQHELAFTGALGFH